MYYSIYISRDGKGYEGEWKRKYSNIRIESLNEVMQFILDSKKDGTIEDYKIRAYEQPVDWTFPDGSIGLAGEVWKINLV